MEISVYIFIGYLNGDRVGRIRLLSFLPAHESSEHTSGSTSGALTSDGGQLSREGLLDTVESRQSRHQTGQARSGGGESGSGGEGVHGGYVDMVLGPVLFPHEDLACLGVEAISCNSPNLPQYRETSTVNLGVPSVQPESVLRKGFACSYRGDGMKVLL